MDYKNATRVGSYTDAWITKTSQALVDTLMYGKCILDKQIM
jgi:hypothetical protein